MNELIKITEKDGRQAVSARELHYFLESGSRFNDWIVRMLEYGFTVNIDYSKLSTENQLIDYALSLDCAKELSRCMSNDASQKRRAG